MLEFNELCPLLVERFIEAGELPNLKKLCSASVVRTTDAEASGEKLNPWVQWVDLHTGKNFKEHGLYNLNEAHKYQGKFTWDILSEKLGLKNWICGSMNAGYGDKFDGRFLPDPWSVNIAPFPPKHMDEYYNFVCQAVHGHSNGGATVPPTAFLNSLLKQGLSFSTAMKLITQVLKEKLFAKDSWERAMVLDWIQFDLFKHYYKKESPDFSTFFSNSVAHYQHHYWRDYEPELFPEQNFTQDKGKSGAILQAYKNSDAIIGKIMEMVDDNTALLFVTALSQQPYTKNERFYYHISDEASYRSLFNIPDTVAYKPVMAHQFNLEATSEEEARALAKSLTLYEMDSGEYFHEGTNQLFLIRREKNVLDVQCRLTKKARENATFIDKHSGQTYSFYESFFRMSEIKSGMHNPIGLYWFYNPEMSPQIIQESCPPAQVHNDVLNYFGAT